MSELLELGKNACDAKYVLQKLTTEEKNKALQTAANDLCESCLLYTSRCV